MLLLVLMLLNPCHPSDSIGDDTNSYPDFNGYHYVYSVNKPALYTDTYLLDADEQVIGHIPLPTPLGTYGPADRIVVCYNDDIQNLVDDGRWVTPTTTTSSTTTTTMEVTLSPDPTTHPTTSVPNVPSKASPVYAATNRATLLTTEYQWLYQLGTYGIHSTTCVPCACHATVHSALPWVTG